MANFQEVGFTFTGIFEFRSKKGFRILCPPEVVQQVLTKGLSLQGSFRLVPTRYYVGLRLETEESISLTEIAQILGRILGSSADSFKVHRISQEGVIVVSVCDTVVNFGLVSRS